MADRHATVRFEATDVSIRPVVSFLVVLCVALVVLMALLWYWQLGFAPEPTARANRLPPEPRIEGLGLSAATHSVTNPDLPNSARSQRLRDEALLRSGWTDARGRRHPPIAEAFRLLIEREGKK